MSSRVRFGCMFVIGSGSGLFLSLFGAKPGKAYVSYFLLVVMLFYIVIFRDGNLVSTPDSSWGIHPLRDGEFLSLRGCKWGNLYRRVNRDGDREALPILISRSDQLNLHATMFPCKINNYLVKRSLLYKC